MKVKYLLVSAVFAGAIMFTACGNDKAAQEAEAKRVADSIAAADEAARLAEEEAARLAEEEAAAAAAATASTSGTKGTGSKNTTAPSGSPKSDVQSGQQSQAGSNAATGTSKGTGSKGAIKSIPSNNTDRTKSQINAEQPAQDAKSGGAKGTVGGAAATQKARP